MKKLILFDLDGTLVETGPGILDSLKKTFKETKRAVPEDKILERFIGPRLEYSFQTYADIPEEEIGLMLKIFRKFYNKEGIFMGAPYPGMVETLQKLSEHCVLAVASAKPQSSVNIVLEHFGLKKYFQTLVGSDVLLNRIHKNEIITEVMKNHPDIVQEEMWMVGDRIYDIQGAKNLGIDSIAALYGYGLDEEFIEATHCITTPGELIPLLAIENEKGCRANG